MIAIRAWTAELPGSLQHRFGVLSGCCARHGRRCLQTHLQQSGNGGPSAAREHHRHLGVLTKLSQHRLVVGGCVLGVALGRAAATIDPLGSPRRRR